MSTITTRTTEDAAVQTEDRTALHDPYALREEDVLDPPTTWSGRLKYLGPGLVISAAVIGSGELITTTALGAKAGFVLLWLVIISTAIKVWVQLELAQWSILNGKPALQGYNQVGPKIFGLGWINVLWILMDFAKILQRGGIIGGTVAAFSIMFPVIGEPLETPSLVFWTVLLIAGVISLLYTNRYGLLERTAFISVVMFTIITVGLALGLPFTPFAYTGSTLMDGLSFAIPAGTLGFAIAMFGLTGVGADEMTTYTYWCIEKGYARWTGPNNGTEERAKRAEGWIKVMRTDVLISWVICTVCTMAFYVIGAAVLHPQGLVPQGNQMITTLSRIYTDTMGDWAHWMFLIGAVTVLGSTLIASTASVPRLWANTLGLLGVIDWNDVAARQKAIRIMTVVFPIIWAIGFLLIQSPVVMVQIGGIASGVFLVAVVIAVWSLRSSEVPARFKRNHVFTAALFLSSFAIIALGIYSTASVFGLKIG
jgi:Mn2+/Fe2+ NRAMP family transporter